MRIVRSSFDDNVLCIAISHNAEIFNYKKRYKAPKIIEPIINKPHQQARLLMFATNLPTQVSKQCVLPIDLVSRAVLLYLLEDAFNVVDDT